jgi:hypothetical protein
MRRIVYDVAVSLDGYIAGKDDDISAFPGEGDHVSAYLARLETYQSVTMGRQTYEFGYRLACRRAPAPIPTWTTMYSRAACRCPGTRLPSCGRILPGHTASTAGSMCLPRMRLAPSAAAFGRLRRSHLGTRADANSRDPRLPRPKGDQRAA